MSTPAEEPGPLTTIVRTQRSAQVRIQIEEAIRRGDFGPGERLPSERELVQTFGVSRVSVREAIRSLEALGIVRVHQGRGAFVSDRRSGLGEPLTRWLMHHRDEVLELHEVRGALDELAAGFAAERHDEASLAKLVSVHETLTEAVLEGVPVGEMIALDLDFHLAIVEAAGNRLLHDLLFDLHTYLAEARRFTYAEPQRPPRSISEHAKIVEAIVAGDAAGARKAMRAHLDGVRDVVLGVMEGTIEE